MRKYMILLLSAILILSLCACASQEAPAAETAAAAATEAPTEATTEAATEAAAEPTEPPTEPEVLTPILVNDKVEIYQRDEGEFTVTMKGLELEEVYTINKQDVQAGYAEYMWGVVLLAGEQKLEITKVHWCFYPGEEMEVSPEDMSDCLYWNTGDSSVIVQVPDGENANITDPNIRCECTEDSITWHFDVPESYLDLKIYEDAPFGDNGYDLTAVNVEDYLVPLEFDLTAVDKVEIYTTAYGTDAVIETFELAQ